MKRTEKEYTVLVEGIEQFSGSYEECVKYCEYMGIMVYTHEGPVLKGDAAIV